MIDGDHVAPANENRNSRLTGDANSWNFNKPEAITRIDERAPAGREEEQVAWHAQPVPISHNPQIVRGWIGHTDPDDVFRYPLGTEIFASLVDGQGLTVSEEDDG